MKLEDRDRLIERRGKEEGRQKQISETITRAAQKGLPAVDIADIVGMTKEEFMKFCSDNGIKLS